MSRPHHRAMALAAGGAAAVALLGFAGPAHADPSPNPSPSSTAPTSTAPSTAAAKCDAKAWGDRVQGRPAHLTAGSRAGDSLWHDSHGFHLRITHAQKDRQVYTGVITATSAMRFDPVKLEKGDVVKLSADKKVLSFAFVNYGYIDGVDFHTDCAAALTVSRLHVGDRDLPIDHVYLGEHRAHPAGIPFTVHRRH